jgi:hypothetical protein
MPGGPARHKVRRVMKDVVLAAVDEAFVVTGATTPGWPDPHPSRDDVRDEEYSRCPHPAKYRIIGARLAAWAQVVSRLGLAQVDEQSGGASLWREPSSHTLARTLLLTPVRQGSLPLVASFLAWEGLDDTVVLLGAGAPAVEVELIPDCGCDACDSGSDDLLAWLDRCVLDVVSGAFVQVAVLGRGMVKGGAEGWSSSAQLRPAEVSTLLAQARAGESSWPVVQGLPWW